jgi:hypothetical protein
MSARQLRLDLPGSACHESFHGQAATKARPVLTQRRRGTRRNAERKKSLRLSADLCASALNLHSPRANRDIVVRGAQETLPRKSVERDLMRSEGEALSISSHAGPVGRRVPESMHSRLVVAVLAEASAHCNGQRNSIPPALLTRLTRIFDTSMKTPTARRVRARGLQARSPAPVGRVPPCGV